MLRRSSLLLALCALAAMQVKAQVLTVFEIKNPAAQKLQQKNMAQLRAIGQAITSHKFPYDFYLSRQLDIDRTQQLRVQQSSIGFDKYNSRMVLKITGNYYAAYSAELMDRNKRARQTFEDVILPILRAAVPPFANDDTFGAFALEISHHVRRKVMGISAENAENVVMVLPRSAAERLVSATTPEEQQVAVLEGEVYVDAEPIALWISGDQAPVLAKKEKAQPGKQNKGPGPENDRTEAARADAPPGVLDSSVSTKLLKGDELPVRLITPATLTNLRNTRRATVESMVRELDAQAHFVPYAPPVFVAFHQGAYLQLSIVTPLAVSGSRYELAALAFDEHIAHLVRPVLAYFPQEKEFDGISFSTTIKAANTDPEAAEFFLPFHAMRCFARYDCTGQQLIDSAIVLINGERASINLQVAEAKR